MTSSRTWNFKTIVATLAGLRNEYHQKQIAIQTQAHLWERTAPPLCIKHNFRTMTLCLIRTQDYRPGEYFCEECYQERVEARLKATKQARPLTASPDYQAGLLLKPYHHAQQEQQTALEHRVSVSAIATWPASKSQPTPKIAHPSTPTPDLRTLLFADDVSDLETLAPYVEDVDPTERRPAVRIQYVPERRRTNELSLCERIEYGLFNDAPTSPHDTGEQEKLREKEKHWML